MSFHEPETAGEPTATGQMEAPDAVKLRVVCHYLVDLINEDGLPELVESLKDNYEFYKGRVKPVADVPLLQSGDGIKVEMGEAHERLPFHIAQE